MARVGQSTGLRPLPAAAAVEVVQSYRCHPRWMLVGFDPESAALHNELWRLAARARFPRRRIYDARLALSLRRQGITEFATANVKDFSRFGFDRVSGLRLSRRPRMDRRSAARLPQEPFAVRRSM